MKELLEFAGAHPWITILSLMLLVHAPVAIIRELRRAPFQSKNKTDD